MQSSKILKGMLACLFVLTIVAYFMLFYVYRPSEVDDAWTASYVWNLFYKKNVEDIVFGAQSNIMYFGHIHAYIAGWIADTFGWSKSVFHALNLFCIASAAVAWLFVALKLTNNTLTAILFILLLFSLEPFIGASYKARSDAMAFMLSSGGVLCACNRRYFLAALVTSIGVEIHAIAGIGYFWMLAFIIPEITSEQIKSHRYKPIIFTLAGIILGFALYRFIHPEPLREIIAYLQSSNVGMQKDIAGFNPLTAHYFGRKYFRFLPELLFWLTGAALFFLKSKRMIHKPSPLVLLFWLTLIASLVFRRSNFHYIIYFYPPLMLLALQGYMQSRLKYAAVVFLAIYAFTMSGALYWQNRHVDHASFDRQLAAISLPDPTLPVLGPTNAWFTLRDRPFFANYAAMRRAIHDKPTAIYFIDGPYSPELPSCAKPSEKALGSIFFNDTESSVYLTNINACPW